MVGFEAVYFPPCETPLENFQLLDLTVTPPCDTFLWLGTEVRFHLGAAARWGQPAGNPRREQSPTDPT